MDNTIKEYFVQLTHKGENIKDKLDRYEFLSLEIPKLEQEFSELDDFLCSIQDEIEITPV